ncbi:MAG: ABC transporter permease [Spirochaetales bacterium]|nr:ABC transporter permease [Spirochaetales bacterium]
MQLQRTISLSWNYFRRYVNRYIFLIIALSLGFSIITVMTGLSAGMTDSVYSAARNHYGGDYFILGYDGDHSKRSRTTDPDVIDSALKSLSIDFERIVKRVNYFSNGYLYHEGNSVRMKNVLGIDWTNEPDTLGSLHIVSGSLDDLNTEDSIIISEVVSQELQAQAGDEVILQGDTLSGQKNTAAFKVAAVFRDTTVFGYFKCFIPITAQQSLLAYGEDEFSSYGLYLNEPLSASQITALHTALSSSLIVEKPISTRTAFNQSKKGRWDGIRYLMLNLGTYVSEVDDLLSAMTIISYFLYIMIIFIILVSINITYRVIIKERTGEIGTLRSIGMQRNDLVSLLLFECLWVFILSLVLGGILAAVILFILSLFSWSGIPGFEIFLKSGKLTAVFEGKTLFMNVLLLLGITMPAVMFPSIRGARMNLTKALSGED